MVKGYEWRQKQTMRQYAQLASWVTLPHVKKPFDPMKLVPDEKTKSKRITKEEGQRLKAELIAEMGGS